MKITRRDVGALLPVLFSAKELSGAGAATELPSKAYPFEDLPVKRSGGNQTRAVLDGLTHTGYPVEVHITNLPPGGAPHPPHHHEHEEMILVQEGTMEVTISGNSTKLGPGSVAYVHSMEEHGWRNVGKTRAQYFVIAIGQKSKA